MNGSGLIHASSGRPDVVLVGGGVAGTMTTLKLAIMPGIGRITLLDREGRFGRGLAYSTNKPWHRTNIPSNKMGGIDDTDPVGFTTWLSSQGHANGPEFDKAFVPGVFTVTISAPCWIRISPAAPSRRDIAKRWRSRKSGDAIA
jgi:hypothetical protein